MSDLGALLNIDPALSRNATADAAMARAKHGLSAEKLKEIDATASNFEAMFASEMLKPMFETVQTDETFGGGQAEETWKGLMVEEYGKKIAAAGGLGLSNDIKAKMIEMQEQANAYGGVSQ